MDKQSLIRGSPSYPTRTHPTWALSLPVSFRRVRAAVLEVVEATANKSLAIIISKTSQSGGTAERTMRAEVGFAVGALNRADEEMVVSGVAVI